MGRLSGRLRLGFVTLAVIAAVALLFGFIESQDGSRISRENAVPGTWAMGDSVPLSSGVEVELVSAGNVPPDSWLERDIEAVPRADRLWLAFDVVNATDGVVHVPSRPNQARVVPSNRVRNVSLAAHIDGVGGGFGVASDPFLEPGDTMSILLQYELIDPERPLEVQYAPFMEESVIFVLE